MRWDVAVVGAGVVGCSVARALAQRGERVLVLEKEAQLAAHQSGRNSGVVHAGFSYAPGSMKARFSVAGARALRDYARAKGLPFREVGKVVVATRPEDVAALERLRAQGHANGVPGLKLLDEAELRMREPNVAGVAALLSRQSAILDAGAYVRALAGDARAAGAEFHLGSLLLAARRDDAWRLRTPQGWHEAERLVTCAGLQSDRVARACGLRTQPRIVPFRGEYYKLTPSRAGLVHGLVYPIPDPRIPFVGVHVTPRTDGAVLLGPSALLALGREAYRSKLDGSARDVGSMASYRGFWRMLTRPEVRTQARAEVARALSKARYARAARALLPWLQPDDLQPSHSGIRAQMVGPDGRFIEDPLLEETEGALHVLNAVSPGLTSSLPFGEHVADRVLAR
jgi:(S)-2-hydroxyglutarate dehydrogenase